MKIKILVLGAGFGGLELCTLLSKSFGESIDVTLIDKNDHFAFGFSKLDVMFGQAEAQAVRLPYANFVKLGVQLLQQTITKIDPVAKRVTTDAGTYTADYLVVALGADYDWDATPGLAEVNEFYSMAGVERLRDVLPNFTRGHALIGVCGAPYKCPPAPSECALMLHDYLERKGVRGACEISFVLPLPAPVPPSPETSKALVAAFAERNIKFYPSKRVVAIDTKRRIAFLDDGLGDGIRPVPRRAQTPRAICRARQWLGGERVGDGQSAHVGDQVSRRLRLGGRRHTGTPKAGVFAEGAAKAVASALIAKVKSGGVSREFDGFGACYIEFGGGRVGKELDEVGEHHRDLANAWPGPRETRSVEVLRRGTAPRFYQCAARR